MKTACLFFAMLSVCALAFSADTNDTGENEREPAKEFTPLNILGSAENVSLEHFLFR